MPKFTFNTTLPKNIPLLIKERVSERPDLYLQASKDSTGTFQYYTYAQVYESILSFALALRKIGVKRYSNVAVISDNRKEWLVVDQAIQSLGAVNVPRGCDSQGKEIRFIISFAECEFGFFENAHQLKKVLDAQEEAPTLKTAIIIQKKDNDSEVIKPTSPINVLYYSDLLEEGKAIMQENPVKGKTLIEAEMQNIEADDLATIIFTSGTTGTPKGVMLTHHNYMIQLSVMHNFFKCKPGDFWLSVLPVWHSFERVMQYFAPLMHTGIAYSKPIGSMMLADMAAVKPQWICCVPRLWEALAHNIEKSIYKKGGLTVKAYDFFINAGTKYADLRDMVTGRVCRTSYRFRPLDFAIAFIPFLILWPVHELGELFLYRVLRAKFGGKISYAVSGGGSLPATVENFYRAINFNLLEAYGLTETAPMLSIRYYKEARPGCVGSVLPTFEVKIVEEQFGLPTNKVLKPGQKGLLLVRGSQIMKGYYKRQDLTDKVIDKDGWFNTGDLALLTYDNELKITGRVKDTIVLLGGENVEPAVIERELCSSNFIESSMVVGQDKKYLGALIVPAKDAVIDWADSNNIQFSDYESLLKDENVMNLIMEEVNTKDSVSNGFRLCDKIYKIALVPDSFKVGEELSAKQEMIRLKISQKYSKEIDELF